MVPSMSLGITEKGVALKAAGPFFCCWVSRVMSRFTYGSAWLPTKHYSAEDQMIHQNHVVGGFWTVFWVIYRPHYNFLNFCFLGWLWMICAVILNTINLYFITIYFWGPPWLRKIASTEKCKNAHFPQHFWILFFMIISHLCEPHIWFEWQHKIWTFVFYDPP